MICLIVFPNVADGLLFSKHADYITDLELLQKINSMFDISDIKNNLRDDLMKEFKNIKIMNSPVQKLLVREIMKEDGFMFID